MKLMTDVIVDRHASSGHRQVELYCTKNDKRNKKMCSSGNVKIISQLEHSKLFTIQPPGFHSGTNQISLGSILATQQLGAKANH